MTYDPGLDPLPPGFIDPLDYQLPHLRNGRHFPYGVGLPYYHTFEMFGATGSGDDGPAMQRTFDRVAGGVIVGRPGRTYPTRQSLRMSLDTTLILFGSTIQNATGYDHLTTLFPASGCTILGGAEGGIDGNRDVTAPLNVFPALLDVGNANDVTIRGLHLRNGRYLGIFLLDGLRATIEDCTIHDCGAVGIYPFGTLVGHTPSEHRFHGNRFWNIGAHPFQVLRHDYTEISNNKVRGNLITAHTVDILPLELAGVPGALGVVRVLQNAGSVFPDFTDYKVGNYFIIGTPVGWLPGPNFHTELTGYQKISNTEVYCGNLPVARLAASPAAGSPTLNTTAAHTFTVGMQVRFTRITGGGGAFDTVTTYFVVAVGANTLELSLALGGLSIAFAVDITDGFLGCYLIGAAAASGTGDMIGVGSSDRYIVSGNQVIGGVGTGLMNFGLARYGKVIGNTTENNGTCGIVAQGGVDGFPQDLDIVGNTVIDPCTYQPAIGTGVKNGISLFGAGLSAWVDGNTVRSVIGAPPAGVGKALYPAAMASGVGSLVRFGRNVWRGQTNFGILDGLVFTLSATWGNAPATVTQVIDLGPSFAFVVTALGGGIGPDPTITIDTSSIPGEDTQQPIAAIEGTSDAAVIAGGSPLVEVNATGTQIVITTRFTPALGAYYLYIVRR